MSGLICNNACLGLCDPTHLPRLVASALTPYGLEAGGFKHAIEDTNSPFHSPLSSTSFIHSFPPLLPSILSATPFIHSFIHSFHPRRSVCFAPTLSVLWFLPPGPITRLSSGEITYRIENRENVPSRECIEDKETEYNIQDERSRQVSNDFSPILMFSQDHFYSYA